MFIVTDLVSLRVRTKNNLISQPPKTYVVGTLKNRLIDTVLLITQTYVTIDG